MEPTVEDYQIKVAELQALVNVPGQWVCSVYSLEEANEKILSIQHHDLEVLNVEMVTLEN